MANTEPLVVAHLTTVDMSLRYLLWPQLKKTVSLGIRTVGISADGPWVEEIESAGIEHEKLVSSTRGVSFWSDVKAAVELWKILRRLKPSILHTHNPKPGIYGRIVGRLAGVPVVVNTVHGLYATEDDPRVKRWVVYAAETLASRFSDVELIQNPEDLGRLSRIPGFPSHKLILLGNGVSLDRFGSERDVEARSELRSLIGVDDSQIVVGIVGRLVREKGYLELIEAMEGLDGRFACVAIGPADPDKADALTDEEIRRGEVAGIRFLGMRDDVERWYKAFDIFVLPSHREGFPRAAMEAAASGLPIVASDIRGCRQVVESEVTGVLVPKGDTAALRNALESMADRPTRESLGDAARLKARREFDERAVVACVIRAYRRAALVRGQSSLTGVLSAGDGAVSIRPAGQQDVPICARLHVDSIAGGFLSSLGTSVLEILYSYLVSDPGSIVLVAEVDEVAVGFVAGSRDSGDLYRRFIKRYWYRVAWRAFPHLIRPSKLRKAIETLRYGTVDAHDDAELLSCAVAKSESGKGIGTSLCRSFVSETARYAWGEVRVVVGATNERAIRLYRSVGFEPHSEIAVHTDEVSLVLRWAP